MTKDGAFDAWIEDIAVGRQAVVPETTEAFYIAGDDNTPMIGSRNLIIAILGAHGKYAATFPTNDPDLTDKVKARRGIEAAAAHWHTLVSDVSKNLVEAWEAGRLR